MYRRHVLTVAAIALSTLLGGCLDGNAYLGGTHSGNGETDAGRRNGDRDDESAGEKKYTYDESRQDSIFIKNTTSDDDVVVELLVERKSDGEILIENAYSIPRKTGLEIRDIALVGDDYAITAKYDGLIEEYEWTVRTCAHEKGSGAGKETALGVDIFQGRIYFVHSNCDESGRSAAREITYMNHEKYILNETCLPCTP